MRIISPQDSDLVLVEFRVRSTDIVQRPEANPDGFAVLYRYDILE
jgi:hypothetical protein